MKRAVASSPSCFSPHSWLTGTSDKGKGLGLGKDKAKPGKETKGKEKKGKLSRMEMEMAQPVLPGPPERVALNRDDSFGYSPDEEPDLNRPAAVKTSSAPAQVYQPKPKLPGL